MKKIGIIVASENELGSLVESLPPPSSKEIYAGIDFSVINTACCEVIIACCGKGSLFAASSATLLISLFGADELINFGYASILADKYRQFELVAVDKILHYDINLATSTNNSQNFEWLHCSASLTNKLLKNKPFEKLNLVSTDILSFSSEQKAALTDFGTYISDNECAGAALIAKKANIPFAAIKLIASSISQENLPEDGLKKASISLGKIVYNYILSC